ncbi:beta/gamma crystallin-related protein [Sediminitomix flava]|uniref:Beta/gamma crystallin n=1 Tax=Sediminitomix flava TaxID=379075 RepID=A0A315ZJM5_SEDFL|nr:beta/gamma crystallin-related protein [Sediminitomix flava]PWJ34101.1 beta/gamma crystallin [Sediminitomix flava]
MQQTKFEPLRAKLFHFFKCSFIEKYNSVTEKQSVDMKGFTKNKYPFLIRVLLVALFSLFSVNIQAQETKQGQVGVVLYEFHEFKGKNVILSEDWTVPRINPWYNRISSISVPPGWTAVVYKLENYQGERLEIQGNWSAEEANPDWDDQISSVKIYKSRGVSKAQLSTIILSEEKGIYGGEVYLRNPSSIEAEVMVDVVVESWGDEKVLRSEKIKLNGVSEQKLGSMYINTGTDFRPYYRKVHYKIRGVE